MTARQKMELALSKSREGLQAAALDDNVETAEAGRVDDGSRGLGEEVSGSGTLRG